MENCIYHEVCGNSAKNEETQICNECIDLTRLNNRENGIETDEFENLIEYMETLYDRLK